MRIRDRGLGERPTRAERFAENRRRFLAGAPLLNLVDRARGC